LDTCLQLKQDGNEMFKQQNYKKALYFYHRIIM
jgi:hypothetical protein